MAPVTTAEPSLRVMGLPRMRVKSASAARQVRMQSPTWATAYQRKTAAAIARTGMSPMRTSDIIQRVLTAVFEMWGEGATRSAGCCGASVTVASTGFDCSLSAMMLEDSSSAGTPYPLGKRTFPRRISWTSGMPAGHR